MHNEYQIEYKNALAIFRNAMAVIVEDDDGTYIPYEREAFGDMFDDLVLNTLITSLSNATLRAEIKEHVTPETISTIDFVLAWTGENNIHKLYFFSANDNEVISLVLQDEHVVDSIEMVEAVSDETLSLIPLSNSMVVISNSDTTTN